MTEHAAADVAPVAPESPAGRPFWLTRMAGVLRAEDWLLAGMVGLAGPALLAAQGGGGPFDPGRPIDGLIRAAGFAGALACLATRNREGPLDRGGVDGAVVGPLTGGLMLVGGSAAASFALDPAALFGPTFAAVVIFSLLGNHKPALPVSVRRGFATLFVLAAGALFWGLVRAILGSSDISGRLAGSFGSDPQGSAVVLALLATGAAVYYAMLVYAPRQVAEREGGALEWLVRFGLFLAGIVFGFGWLSALGT